MIKRAITFNQVKTYVFVFYHGMSIGEGLEEVKGRNKKREMLTKRVDMIEF